MIGNVWEWTDSLVNSPSASTRQTFYGSPASILSDNFTLPSPNYVSSFNFNKLFPTVTSVTSNPTYGDDNFWKSGTYAATLRGGGFVAGDGTRGGRFGIHLDADPTTGGATIGARCAIVAP